MSIALQLAEFLGASWLLWRLSALLYRPRSPRDARGLNRWPVEVAEPAARRDRPVNVRGEE